MDRVVCMEAFVRVAEAPGFAEAARRWGRSKAVVSKYVAQLEEDLGVALLQRSTRAVTLTDAGHTHYDNCRDILGRLHEAEAQLKSDHLAPRGPLRLSAPPGLFGGARSEVLTSFCRDYPEVTIRLDVTDRLVDLVEARVDIAVRVTKPKDSSLIARRLAPMPLILVAAPSYIQANGHPASADDLRNHACLVNHNLADRGSWPLHVEGGGSALEVGGALSSNDPFVVRDFATAGLGIALVPRLLAEDDLAKQRLVEVLPGSVHASPAIYAVTSQRRHLSAAARAFIEHLRKRLPLAVDSP